MGWYRNILTILKSEPEEWLCYLYGQKLEDLPHLMKLKSKYTGFLAQVAKYVAYILKNAKINEKKITNSDFLFYFGTENQRSALESTIESLRNKNFQLVMIAPGDLSCNEVNPTFRMTFNPSDILRALILLVRRSRGLFNILKYKDKTAAAYFFSKFLCSHIYLCFFYRVLIQSNPEFVVIANDHSCANRCLLAVARHLEIKTVYLQHASVSEIFPALCMDYAFLDGVHALEIYQKCKKNAFDGEKRSPPTQIFLTGQKKKLPKREDKKGNIIGVATNTTDDAEKIIFLIKYLLSNGLEVRFRWHPLQPIEDIRKYKNELKENNLLIFSDPHSEPLADFISKVAQIICGDSSIHLEAALSGVIPIYYKATEGDIRDYYGFVSKGLCREAKNPQNLLSFIRGNIGNREINMHAIQYYSSTFGTKWQGQEGLLAALLLEALINNDAINRMKIFPYVLK
tara:strand:+ start:14754 stop:16121 length:1368 start_codon:yes stop_codon:yes gene_type:complete